jgi:hypothetical protein
MKVGDTVKLIRNTDMSAPIGSTAKVLACPESSRYIVVEWIDKGDSGQMDGSYYPENFKVVESSSKWNTNIMEQSHLAIAKELIELKWNVKVVTIEFEDGSGRKFIVTDNTNPAKKRFVML